MPRKKTESPIQLIKPNLISVNELEMNVRHHDIKQHKIQCMLLFHVLAEPCLSLTERTDMFVPIHYDHLRSIFGMNYSKVITALVEEQYILMNPYYAEYLGICRSYALHPRIHDASKSLESYTIDKQTKVYQKKMDRMAATNLSKCVDVIDECRQHVIDQTANLVLMPDSVALDYVKQHYSASNNPNDPDMYFKYWNANPLKGVHVDTFGKRVHSNITNMPKVLRRCLRFKDDINTPVQELDIVNSQPFFLSIINAMLIDTFVPECSSAVPVYARYEATTDYIRFRDLCSSGLIYEELLKLYKATYGTSYGINDEDAREVTKGLIYGVFFSDYRQVVKGLDRKARNEASQLKKHFFSLFMNVFPSVFNLFNDLKSLYWNFTVNSKGIHKQYANNCLLAQRLESAIIFECVVNDLVASGITSVVTVHDCCIVKQHEAEAAKQIMYDTFNKVGIQPVIK